MKHQSTTTIIAALVLSVCISGAAVMARRLEKMRAGSTLEDVLYVTSPKMAKYMSLGYTGLAADIYWTRAVQYFGRKHNVQARRYDLLEPLLLLTASLDPHLITAYEFGSFFLAQKPPEGAGNPDAAVKLVERGIKENPDEWRLYYHLGFIHYVERNDPLAASEAFAEGAKNPKAYPWMKVMAASMRQRGGDLETARYLWTNIYESTQDKQIKENALYRLASLKVDEDVTQLEKVIAAFRQQTGSLPQSWQQLVTMGWLRKIPTDPTGGLYKLIPDGSVQVQNPKQFPFLTKGLPEGQSATERITKDTYRPAQ